MFRLSAYQVQRDEDRAGDDITHLTAALAALAECLGKLEALGKQAHRNHGGNACDAIGEVAGEFDDLRAPLILALTDAEERHNRAALALECRP